MGEHINEQASQQRSRPVAVRVDLRRSPGDKSVVFVTGELIGGATAAMRRTVDRELKRSPAELALELSGVTRIDAAGIDALVAAARQAGESDISFCLVGVRGRAVGIALANADLTDLFEIFPAIGKTRS
jgi:anti-anti-sigma factor